MRPVVVQVPAEDRGHEQRDDGDGLSEAGQLPLEPQICLIAAEAVHGEVRALDPHHGADLRGHAVLPRQIFPEHHGLADEQDRRLRGIDRFVQAPDTISRRIERVVDDARAGGVLPGSCRLEGPAEAGIGAAAWFLLRHQPADGARVNEAQDQFTRTEREDDRDGRWQDGSRRRSGEASGPRAQPEQEPHTAGGHHDADRRLDQHQPRTRQEPRR